MKAIVKALYNEPVLASGVLLAAATALVAASVIAAWIPLVLVAVLTPISRYYSTPDQPQP